jgi:hypothetical protein
LRPKANLAPLMKDLIFRRAEASDLPAIIAMLADDILGRQREDPSTPPNAKYLEALPVYPGRPQPIAGGGDPERRSDREPANHFHSRHRTSGRLAWPDRGCPRRGQASWIWVWPAHVRMGDRAMPRARLHHRPTDDRQDPSRRSPLLRPARFRRQPRRLQTHALDSLRWRALTLRPINSFAARL